MTTEIITNQTLYDLIIEFKNETYKRFEQIDSKFEQIDSKFEQIDSKFEQINSRLDQMDKRSDHIESRLDHIESRLDRIEDLERENQKVIRELWQTRQNMTVNFSKAFAGANAFISAVIAVIVSLFIKKT